MRQTKFRKTKNKGNRKTRSRNKIRNKTRKIKGGFKILSQKNIELLNVKSKDFEVQFLKNPYEGLTKTMQLTFNKDNDEYRYAKLVIYLFLCYKTDNIESIIPYKGVTTETTDLAQARTLLAKAQTDLDKATAEYNADLAAYNEKTQQYDEKNKDLNIRTRQMRISDEEKKTLKKEVDTAKNEKKQAEIKKNESDKKNKKATADLEIAQAAVKKAENAITEKQRLKTSQEAMDTTMYDMMMNGINYLIENNTINNKHINYLLEAIKAKMESYSGAKMLVVTSINKKDYEIYKKIYDAVKKLLKPEQQSPTDEEQQDEEEQDQEEKKRLSPSPKTKVNKKEVLATVESSELSGDGEDNNVKRRAVEPKGNRDLISILTSLKDKLDKLTDDEQITLSNLVSQIKQKLKAIK